MTEKQAATATAPAAGVILNTANGIVGSVGFFEWRDDQRTRKGTGYIICKDAEGGDLRVRAHWRFIVKMGDKVLGEGDFRTLYKGEKVQFDAELVRYGNEGDSDAKEFWRATNVVVLEPSEKRSRTKVETEKK